MKAPWELPLHEYRLLPEASLVPRGSILAARPDQISREWLDARPLDDLRDLAVVLDVPRSGLRDEVTERILRYWALRRLLSRATPADLKVVRASALRAWLKSVGVYAPSNRYGMAAALIGWRDRSRLNGSVALAKALHYRHVRRAVRLGLAVPPDVLACYPDLQERAGDYPLFAAAEASAGKDDPRPGRPR